MSEPRGRLLVWIGIGALLIALLLARLVVTMTGEAEGLPVLGTVPDFALTDQSGERFGSADLRGKTWVASFIYTTCPGPCPRVVQRMAEVRRTFGADSRLMLVSFSVDPQADTPDVLAAYAHTHAIDANLWKLLTGAVEEIVTLIQQGFYLGIARADELDVEVDPEAGPVIHSVKLVLVDPSMRIRGFYDSDDPGDMEALIAAIPAAMSEAVR